MKPEREMDSPGCSMIDPVNEIFAATPHYQNYRFLEESSVMKKRSHYFHKRAKKIAVQVKDSNIFRERPDVSDCFLPTILVST